MTKSDIEAPAGAKSLEKAEKEFEVWESASAYEVGRGDILLYYRVRYVFLLAESGTSL